MSRKTLTNSASSPVLNHLRTLTGLHSHQLYCLSTPASQRLPLSHPTPRRHLSSSYAHHNTTGFTQVSQANLIPRRRVPNATNKRQQSRNASTESSTSVPTPTDAKARDPANPETGEDESESEPKSKSAAPLPSKAKNNTQWPAWRIQKEALKSKFEEGWAPRRRLSPDAMEGVRELHEKDPVKFSTPVLAQEFKVSAEAIRRILKSKWRPSEKESVDRRGRWERRESRIWDHMVQVGLRPERTEDPETGAKKLNRKYPRSKTGGKGKRA